MIKVTNLTKDFKIHTREKGLLGAAKSLFSSKYTLKRAVDNISFTIEPGEIVGYIGPNGAGKSTTIKMLVGILVPTSGSVEVNGLRPYEDRIENARNMGVVFGQRTQLWWDIPVSESLYLMKHMYKIPEKQFKHNMELFSDILGIDQFMQTPVRQLSLGQKMRADLCAALLHNPEILYLDEPTIGLDVVVKEKIREFIKEVNTTRKTTVILTTHDITDIEKLCSRVIVIDQGRVMYDGNLDNLKVEYGSVETIRLDFVGDIGEMTELRMLGIDDCNIAGNTAIVTYNKHHVNSSKVIGWFMARTEIKDFVVSETEVEEVIRRIYQQGGSSNDRSNGR